MNLKKIDTQEKAYFLGFMDGDGTITNFIEKTGRIRYLTRISIHENDNELIYKLHEYFPFFRMGIYDFSKHNKNSSKQISLSKSSKELYQDLLSNGVFPRKFYENKDKLHLPDIDRGLIPHFIRGFFDADGSVYIPSNRENLLNIEFCGVSKTLIYELNEYLKSKGIDCWKIKEKHPSIHNKQILYQLCFNKTSEVLKLIDLMYSNSHISMKRKADKCLNYKPVDKVKDRNIICPSCNSVNNWVKGYRTSIKRGKYCRYECQNCGKIFS